MSKNHSIHLPSTEREQLEQLIAKGNAPARVQTRARILLLTDASLGKPRTNAQIAEVLFCAPATVHNIRTRYCKEGLSSALYEKPRPGNPRKLDGVAEAQLLLLACSEAPKGHAQWTLSLLADRMVSLGVVESLGRTTVFETLKKTRLSPGKSRRGALEVPPLST